MAIMARAQSPGASPGKKPNILVIMGDDIGWYNPSIYHRGGTWGTGPPISIASARKGR
jgi:hypothetical protein